MKLKNFLCNNNCDVIIKQICILDQHFNDDIIFVITVFPVP